MLLVAGVAVATTRDTQAVEESWSIALADFPYAAAASGDEDCGICDYCESAELDHIAMANANGPRKREGGWHDDCFPGGCVGNHDTGPPCTAHAPDALAVDKIRDTWIGIRSGDLDPVEIARKHASNVKLNRERNALQIFSCDGLRVIAHIPLASGSNGM
ncbi:MAG: hypothetical protein ACRENP_05455 [Longimicrobiales bacterium]